MENTSAPQKHQRSWKFIFMMLLLVAMAVSGYVYTVLNYSKSLSDTQAKLLKEQQENSTCTYKRDSLFKEVQQLSIYKALTKAMVHRDEATVLLSHQVGDFVYLKRDSARAVISDIIIGGSKYEYYIKYKVLYKDNSTEEVIPELIY